MFIISGRFESNILQHFTDENNFHDQCTTIDFKKIIPQHLELTLEYEIYVSSLLGILRPYHNQPEIRLTNALIDALMTARKMAIFLAELYQNYLCVSRQSVQLRKDEAIIRHLLNYNIDCEQNRSFNNQNLLHNPWEEHIVLTPDWFTRKLRELFFTANWARLFTFRSRKLITALRNVAEEISVGYHSLLNKIESSVHPILLFVAWIFYIPRLLNNIFLLFKHFLPHPWMSQEEENLGATIRLRATMQRRGFELVGDTVWFTTGVLSCFLLVGALTPVSIYLGIGLYAFDLILASTRAYIELRRLLQLRKDFYNSDPNLLIDNLQDLEHRMAYEKRRLYTHLGGSVGLMFAIGLTAPLMAVISPMLPIIGAVLLITITLAVYLILRKNETTKPATTLSELTKFSFFKEEKNKSEHNLLEIQHPQESLSQSNQSSF